MPRSFAPVRRRYARLVVLVSGSGTNLQALLDACRRPSYEARVIAVGADRPGIEGLARAQRAGVDTFVCRLAEHSTRQDWDASLADRIGAYRPDLVVLAGFMKLTGPAVLARFDGRVVNTHPALSPSFPGMHAVRDAVEHGVRVSGATLFVVDAGVDTGPIVAQVAVPVDVDDTAQTLHERIKISERTMLVDTVGSMLHDGYCLDGRKVRIGA
ncbi:MAG: phosphoribosylglycinamide formyltransferase [Actinomycetota bacterium]|nr:phosphoribosylglycinamide formyltransferase [Actinomycetota bacterium]